LLTASRQDLAWQQAGQATPRVAWLRQVACQAEQAVDLPPRLADRDFPSLALRLKSVSASRLVSVMQMEQRMARAGPWEQRKLALRVGQSAQQVPVLSLPNPQLLIPSRAQLESAPRLCSCRSRRKSQALSRLPRARP